MERLFRQLGRVITMTMGRVRWEVCYLGTVLPLATGYDCSGPSLPGTN